MIEPGPRLDALIAEHVFGLKFFHKGETKDFIIGTTGWYGPGQSHVIENIPCYSTSIADAWQVVEKLKEITAKGWSIDVEEEIFPINIIWDNNSNMWELKWSSNYWKHEHSTTAKTAPHAICLAALKAVGVEV